MTSDIKDRTEFFKDEDGDNVLAVLMDDETICIDIQGVPYLTKLQASEFAKQLLYLCGPEYKI